MKLTRRTVIHSAASVALAPALDILRPRGAAAQTAGNAPEWRHALSLFDEVRYPPDFKHFDYVNPQAPKGGTARMIAFGTFDNFNRVVAGVKGSHSILRDLEALKPSDYPGNLALLLDFAPHIAVREVPDPYFGGPQGFEDVLDLVEEASRGLLAKLR